MGHLGSRVSALLDGRLDPAEEERAWAHVHACHPCRDLVEREGWVKTRLAGLSTGCHGAPDGLKSSLLGGGALSSRSATPSDFLSPLAGGLAGGHSGALPGEPPTRPRHRGLMVIGGGAAGAAVVGVLALGAATGGANLERRAPASEIDGPTPTTSLERAKPPARREQDRQRRSLVVREKMDR